ncbi:RDD family protein [Streptosporangium sp. NPDC006013]|uniref:RDD family protein n=1 Tax=Streptosporangium sp. NPDC006013 TaxID=3155596 RepID=UPI0033B604CB
MTTTPHAPTTWTLAARRHRLGAAFVDALIFFVAISPLYWLLVDDLTVSYELTLENYFNPYLGNPYWPVDVGFIALYAAYFWLQHALWGQTLGKRLCRLKVLSRTTGETPSLGQSGIRAIVYATSSLVPYLGMLINLIDMLWIFVDPKRRCLHDVIAETVVVDLGAPGRKKFGGGGFLFGLGVLITLFAAIVLLSLLMVR